MADTTKHDQAVLDPKERKYEVDGTTYHLNPPKMRHLGRVMYLSGLFQKAQDGERVPDADMDEAESQLDATINELTQEEIDGANLSISKKLEILGFLSEMIGTADQRALAERQMKQTGKAAASGSRS